MEHHKSPIGTIAARSGRATRGPLSRAAAGLAALMLLAGAAGCGGSSATPSATLETLSGDVEFGTQAAGAGVATTGPVVFAVKDSSGNPVAGADIDIYAGGSHATAGMALDFLLTTPAGTGIEWHTKTSDTGTVQLFPFATLGACGGATADLDGSFQVDAVISGATAVWTASFTLDCA